MADVEIIDFFVPAARANSLYVSKITTQLTESALHAKFYESFSSYGLINQVCVNVSDQGDYYAFIRFYSGLSARRARSSALQGRLTIEGCETYKVAIAHRSSISSVPLARFKCEELANYYLGFNGWRSKVLYHRREESDELIIKYVTVVSLQFPMHGVCCEGAGLTEEIMPDEEDTYITAVTKAAKKSIGEAHIAAWSKVLLVVVDGRKVSVEVNTTATDKFLYNPLWGEPEVTVNDVSYPEELTADGDAAADRVTHIV